MPVGMSTEPVAAPASETKLWPIIWPSLFTRTSTSPVENDVPASTVNTGFATLVIRSVLLTPSSESWFRSASRIGGGGGGGGSTGGGSTGGGSTGGGGG